MPTIPDALAMRSLKYGGAPEEQREQVAQTLRQAGRHTEALLLYEGRAQHPALAAERARAVAKGLAFPLLTLRRIGAPVSDDDVRACARAAEAAGRWLDARQAYLALGDAEAVVRLAPHLPASYAPPPPPPAPPTAPGAPAISTSA